MDVVMIASTNGKGEFTTEKRDTQISKIMIDGAVEDANKVVVNIKAKVSARTWQTLRDGLIFTDARWLKDFRRGLVELGLPQRLASKVKYSTKERQTRLHVGLELTANKKDLPLLEEFFVRRIRVTEAAA